MQPWMNASEAAQHLGVSRQTLYAYVSRGLLRPEPAEGERASRYRSAEVQRLALQRSAARNPKQAAQATLDWGLPVLGSALTLIRDGRLYYRGQDAVALAEHAALEDVAALLWQCDAQQLLAVPAAEPATPSPRRRGSDVREGVAAFHRLLSAHDERAHGPPAEQGMQLLRWMRHAMTGRTLAAGTGPEMHRQLQAAWRLSRRDADTVRAALVLCTDHELNASSFTARCVASTGATLPACVAAALLALTGPRHGGATISVDSAWDDWMRGGSSRSTLRQQIRATVLTPGCTPQGLGFGHPLYPAGDPRAVALLARLPPDALRDRWIAEVHDLSGLRPSVDFALVALRRSLGLPRGAALALFAIARTVGWIAHALEQRASGALIRPRAAYVGPLPAPAAAAAPAGRVIRRR